MTAAPPVVLANAVCPRCDGPLVVRGSDPPRCQKAGCLGTRPVPTDLLALAGRRKP